MTNELTRRDILRGSVAGLGALALPEWAFPALAQGEELVPFTDYPIVARRGVSTIFAKSTAPTLPPTSSSRPSTMGIHRSMPRRFTSK